MRPKLASPDALVASIAARQHGVVTVAQLVEANLTPSAVKRRLAAGRLHRVYRGVYAVGHAGLSNEGRWMAAVLACGEGSVLSHRSAAEHLGLLAVRPGPVHVTIAGLAGRARRRGLRIHHSSSLAKREIWTRDGIAVTAPGRTLADLSRTEPAAMVAKAARAANYKGWGLGGEGVAAGRGGQASERSELERRFLRLCARRRLQRPEVNATIGPYIVDFLWRRQALIAETDGWQGHRGRQAFEDDRARDLFLRTEGFEVLRFTWRQVTSDPGAVAAVLRRYLSQAA